MTDPAPLTVDVTTFRALLTDYLDMADSGQRIIITRRGRPAAQLSRPPQSGGQHP